MVSQKRDYPNVEAKSLPRQFERRTWCSPDATPICRAGCICAMAKLAVAVLFAFFAASNAASGPSSALRELRLASSQAPSGVVRLGPANYTSYALAGPRDYALLVMFTVSEAKYGCAACGPAAKEFAVAAKSYASAHAVQFNLSAAAAAAQADDRTSIFAVVDFKWNQEAFQSHGFNSVPQLALFQPTTATTKAPRPGTQVTLGEEQVRSPSAAGAFTAESMLRWLPDGAGIAVQRPAGDRRPLVIAATVLLALIGAVATWSPSNLTPWRQTWFWRLASWGVFAIAVSGAIGCVIRASPWYGYSRDGKAQWFSSSSGHHDQFVLEGVAVGALTLAFAGSVVCLVALSKGARVSTFTKAALACVLLAVVVVLGARILALYEMKTSWYRASTLLQSSFWTFWQTAPATARGTWKRAIGPALVKWLNSTSTASNTASSEWVGRLASTCAGWIAASLV